VGTFACQQFSCDNRAAAVGLAGVLLAAGQAFPLPRSSARLHERIASTILQARVPLADLDDDFAPLDVKVVIAEHAYGSSCARRATGCGTTCATSAPALTGILLSGPTMVRAQSAE